MHAHESQIEGEADKLRFHGEQWWGWGVEYKSSHTLEADVSQAYAPGPPHAHSATAMFSRLQITAVTATPSLRSVRR